MKPHCKAHCHTMRNHKTRDLNHKNIPVFHIMTLNKESLFKFHENKQPVVFESAYV